jgi:hypothetical protein
MTVYWTVLSDSIALSLSSTLSKAWCHANGPAIAGIIGDADMKTSRALDCAYEQNPTHGNTVNSNFDIDNRRANRRTHDIARWWRLQLQQQIIATPINPSRGIQA